ncbi:hypothetical protein [Brucepastera parasyntrophica]|uniref:hypothetical protein n=1 Tax=Brucepastera parasyntrophica TaxID=2880008 RepID=UPI003F705889
MEESWFFDALSYTYLPLLRSCAALEAEGVPFRFAIAFSPTFCEMLADQTLQTRYVDYLEHAIELGISELEKDDVSPEKKQLIKQTIERIRINLHDYVEVHEMNILRKFDYFAGCGYIEILATTATPCFIPLFIDIPETINAQIETGLVTYRKYFTSIPSGFWLPALGWAPGIDSILKSYGFKYTILESHGILFADQSADSGIFAPAYCKNGFAVIGRDKFACQEVTDPEEGLSANPVYLDINSDIGFYLDKTRLSGLYDVSLGRRSTGFRFYSKERSPAGESMLYSPERAAQQLETDVKSFLHRRLDVLREASRLDEKPVFLACAFPASFLEMYGTRASPGLKSCSDRLPQLTPLCSPCLHCI